MLLPTKFHSSNKFGNKCTPHFGGFFCRLNWIFLAWPSRVLFLSARSYIWCTLTAGETVNRIASEVRFNFTMKVTVLHLAPSFLGMLEVELQHLGMGHLMPRIVMKRNDPHVLNKKF